MLCRRTLLAAPALLVGASTSVLPRRIRAGDLEPVDAAIVLAVDMSSSVTEESAQLQRNGYCAAVANPRFITAVGRGMIQAVAIQYVEWGSVDQQHVRVPWMRIGSQTDANVWAAELAKVGFAKLGWTSISGAIGFSRQQLGNCPFEATRKVIDVSGDGPNNSGPDPEAARNSAVADGIIINGLPILPQQPSSAPGVLPLDMYFHQNVIGGPNAFVVAAEGLNTFGEAILRKLAREIANHGGSQVERVHT